VTKYKEKSEPVHNSLSALTSLLSALLFVNIYFLLSALPSFSEEFLLSGYTEAGIKSTSDDFDDEDVANDYEYVKYGLRLKLETDNHATYDIGSYLYKKNYITEDALDNISKIIKGRASYSIGDLGKKSLLSGISLKYREKRYDNSPQDEYNQFAVYPSLTFKKKDVYTARLSAGFDSFNYLKSEEKDRLRVYGKINLARYPVDRRLKLSTSYKFEALNEEKKDRERYRHDAMGGLDYALKTRFIYRIIARAKWGQRDTKEDDERDVDYDYEYRLYYVKTEHTLSKQLKTSIKYQYYSKDYAGADLDHSGFFIRNRWNYKLLDDREKSLTFTLNGEHKEVDYSLKTGKSYIKYNFKIRSVYRKKKNWKAAASLKSDFYDFEDSEKNKNRYSCGISGEKLFLAGKLAFSVDLKYRHTDYKQQNDNDNTSARVAFRYKF
jgi:hypothetical protein